MVGGSSAAPFTSPRPEIDRRERDESSILITEFCEIATPINIRTQRRDSPISHVSSYLFYKTRLSISKQRHPHLSLHGRRRNRSAQVLHLPNLPPDHEGPGNGRHRDHLRPSEHREMALRRQQTNLPFNKGAAIEGIGANSEPHSPPPNSSLVHGQRLPRRRPDPYSSRADQQTHHQ